MAIKLPESFDKKEDIPPFLVDNYEEKDGKFILKQEEDEAEGLKSALKKERERADKAEKAMKDADKKRKQEEEDNKRKNQGVTDEQLKKIRDEVKAELEEEYKPLKARVDTLAADNRNLRLDTQVKSLMGGKNVGVKASRHDTLWKLVKDDFDLTEDGKPMVKDSPGTTVEKYLATKVKELYPEFYEGTQATGGGAAGDTKTPPSPGTGTLTADQILANPSAAMQAARASGVKQ